MLCPPRKQAGADALKGQLAQANAAADATAAAHQELQRKLQRTQDQAAAAQAAASAAQAETAAAREALQGLTAEVEQQRLDGGVDALR